MLRFNLLRPGQLPTGAYFDEIKCPLSQLSVITLSSHSASNTAAMDTGTQISVTEPSLCEFLVINIVCDAQNSYLYQILAVVALAMRPWLAAVHLHLILRHLLYP
jgi:hypothetical protein